MFNRTPIVCDRSAPASAPIEAMPPFSPTSPPPRRVQSRRMASQKLSPISSGALDGAEKELGASGGLEPFLSYADLEPRTQSAACSSRPRLRPVSRRTSNSAYLRHGGVTSPTTIMSRFSPDARIARVNSFPSVPLPAFGRLPEHAMRCGVGEGLISEMHLIQQRYAELLKYTRQLEAEVMRLRGQLAGLNEENREST